MESLPNSQPLTLHHNGSQPQLVPSLYTAEAPYPDEDELELGKIFAALRRRALWIAGITIAVTTGVYFWTAKQTQLYEGHFQILVEPVTGDNKLSSKLSSLAGGLGASFFGEQSAGLDYESQIAVLQSPKLMNPIIEQLQVRYPEMEYNSLIGGKKPPLALERVNKTTKILQVRYRDSDTDKIQFVLEKLKESYLRYSLEDRKTNVRQGIQFIEDQLPQLRQRVDTLQEQLQKFRQQYNLIDPEIQGKQLAEQVSKVKDQLLEAQTQVAQQQQLVQNLRGQLGQEPGEAIALSVLSEAPRYQELLNQLQKVETDIQTESARFTANSPQIQALVDKRDSLIPLLRQEAERALGQDLGSSKAIPEPLKFQNSIRLKLTQEMVEAFNQFQVSQLRYKAIQEADKFYSKQLKEFPIIVRQYTDLMRELKLATETLNQLLAQRETLRVESAQKEVPWELIAKPEIPRDKEGQPIVVSPNIPRNVVLGAMLGLILGCGVALLAERLDNVFHTPEDLKEATRLPMLGLIPVSDSARQLPNTPLDGGAELGSQRDFTFIEAFRALNTNIRFLNAGSPIRSVAIASATAADGKSTVAVNLAQAAAAMGQRVLLVDADLRWPQVHLRLGLLNKQGLSNVIATDLDLNDAIQRSPVEENLFVLTAGAIPPDPIRLLSSAKMQNLMKHVSADFDFVIYDTPPLLGVVDGRLLAGYTDGIGLVVSIGKTDRGAIEQALEELQTSSTPILGIISNGVKGETTGWYEDHHRYHRHNSGAQQLDEETVLQ